MADEASQALLLSLSRLQAELPLLIVALCSPHPDVEAWSTKRPESPQIHRLKLGRLAAPAVAELVNQQLGGQVAPLLVELVQAQSQGNPLLAKELIMAWRDAGQLQQQADGAWQLAKSRVEALERANCLTQDAAGQWRLVEQPRLAEAKIELPDSLQEALADRLERLPAPLGETLAAASVIGPRFEVELLAAVHPAQLDDETLLNQLDRLQKAELIQPEQPTRWSIYRFTPSLGQEIIYAGLPNRQKQASHRAVAEALERRQPGAVERLAYHFGRGEAQDKHLFYLEQAAGRAQRLFANETVLACYSQALAIEERWPWRSSQIRTLHVLGRREEERANLEALATNLETPTFELALLWGQYYEAIADYPKAQEAVELALADSRDKEDLIDESRCLAYLGLIARRQGNYRQAQAWYQQALVKLQQAPNLTELEARWLTQVYNGLGAVYGQQGEFGQSRQCHEEALRLSHQYGNRSGEAQACNDLGVTTFYQRQLDEAAVYHQQALDIRRAIGDRAGEGISLYNLAQITHDAGDYGQAQQQLSEALRILRTTGNRWDEINVLNDLGILYQELGDWSKAEACLQQGLALAQEIGDQAGQAYLLANLGLVARDKGKLETAENLFTTGLILARAQNDQYLASSFLNYLSSVNLQIGQPEQAITQAKASLVLRRELKMHYATPDNLTILARSYLALGDLAEAVERATQAEQILVECAGEGPEFPQQDYYFIYQVLTAAGQFKRAERALESAHRLVMARADKIIDPYLRQSFLERVTLNRTIIDAYQAAATAPVQN